jgi:hypothetical protein
MVVSPVDRIRLHERSNTAPKRGESSPLADFQEAGRLTTSLPLDRSAQQII